MTDYKAYPSYAGSGVEWLGPIPSHWKALRGLSALSESRAKNDPLISENYLSLMANRGIIPYAEKGDIGNKKPDDLTKCKLVARGDFVINSMNYAIGSYGVSPYDGIVSSVYVVMKHNATVVAAEFMDLIFSNPVYQQYAQSFGTGILDHRRAIGWDEIKIIRIPIPPIAEQVCISRNVQRERARINELIEKKERFIELLNEKRQALIIQAVTKGLDPKAQMKESGVEWIGEVPAHWKIAGIGHVSTIATGGTPDRTKEKYWGGEVPWIKTGEVDYEVIREAREHLSEEGLANSAAFVAPPGTILMAMYGMGVTRGRVAILGIRAAFNQACAAIVCADSWNNWFAFYSLWAAYRYIRDLGNEASQINLNLEIISKIKIPLPDLSEQARIVKHLEAKLPNLKKLEDMTLRSIEILQERRSALITAAVTGQVDLREVS